MSIVNELVTGAAPEVDVARVGAHPHVCIIIAVNIPYGIIAEARGVDIVLCVVGEDSFFIQDAQAAVFRSYPYITLCVFVDRYDIVVANAVFARILGFTKDLKFAGGRIIPVKSRTARADPDAFSAV